MRGKPPGAGLPKFSLPENGIPVVPILALLIVLGLDFTMLMMLFGAYSETMAMGSDAFLCNLPAMGQVFCYLDEEITVAHLLSFLLAVFSLSVPLYLWHEIIRLKIYEEPQAWFSKPANRVYAGIALVVFALVFTLETINLYALIAKYTASQSGPFLAKANPNAMMDTLSANDDLAVFVAALIAVVNALLALMTARAMHALRAALKGEV